MYLARVCAKTHCAAHFYAVLVGHKVYHAVFGRRVELGRVCVLKAEYVAGVFYDRSLHSETDAKIGDIVFTGVFCGENFTFYAAVAEAAGDEYAVYVAEEFSYGGLIDFFCVHPLYFHLCSVFVACVRQRFGYR